MMGHREKLIDGDEFDGLTLRGKRVHIFRAGDRAKLKRKFSKRVRREAMQALATMTRPNDAD